MWLISTRCIPVAALLTWINKLVIAGALMQLPNIVLEQRNAGGQYALRAFVIVLGNN